MGSLWWYAEDSPHGEPMVYYNDEKQGLEIQYRPYSPIQTFFGNTKELPKPGDVIKSRGTSRIFVVTEVFKVSNTLFRGECKEKKA